MNRRRTEDIFERAEKATVKLAVCFAVLLAIAVTARLWT